MTYRGLPLFICDKVRPNRDYPEDALVVSFRCTCGIRHEHGWGVSEAGNLPQHRVAHCAEQHTSGYYIRLETP